MRKLVLLLALLCVVFAGTTIYFARELADERARRAALTETPVAPAPASAPAARIDEDPTVPAAASSPPAAASVVAKDSASEIRRPTDEELKVAQSQYAGAFLEQLADPQARADLIAERRMQMRQTFPSLERVVGLSAEEYSRLLNLIAEEQVKVQAEHSR